MKPTEQIKYIVDQIVIAYCNLDKFGGKEFEDDLANYTAQLMQITGLNREGALKYAVDFLAAQNKVEGVA